MHGNSNIKKKIAYIIVSFIKIGALKAILHLGAWHNACS